MLFGERILVSWSKPKLTTVNLHSFVVFSASTIVLLRVLHICCLLLRNLVKKNCDLVMTFAMPHLLTLAPKKWWNANNCFGEYHETWKRSRLQFHALFNDTETRNSLDTTYLKIYINRKWVNLYRTKRIRLDGVKGKLFVMLQLTSIFIVFNYSNTICKVISRNENERKT